MNLASTVQEQIRRFVVGLVSADDLSDWLDAHAQQIHDAGDSELRRLTDTAFALLEDVLQGQRTEKDGRAALSELIAPVQSYMHSATSWGSTATAAATVTSVAKNLDFQVAWPVGETGAQSGALLPN